MSEESDAPVRIFRTILDTVPLMRVGNFGKPPPVTGFPPPFPPPFRTGLSHIKPLLRNRVGSTVFFFFFLFFFGVWRGLVNR